MLACAVFNCKKKYKISSLQKDGVTFHLNRALPLSQQIDVTLDPRPLEVQEKELDEAKALTVRKLAHQLEASDLGLQKMYHRNIIQLDVFPFKLRAIRDPTITIRILRQKNLSKAFYEQLEQVHEKMAEAALKGRREESTTRRIGTRKLSYGPPRVASFLLGLPPKPPHSLKKAIRDYYARLTRHHLQFIEWQEHLLLKPDPNAMPPGAAEALREAEDTIGNRLLKTQPDYIAPPGHNTQLRVCLTRKEIYDSKHEFNEKVIQLREHKLLLVKKIKDIGERLAEIRIEVAPNYLKSSPPLPEIDESVEFPEKNLEIKPEAVRSLSKAAAKKGLEIQERRKTQPQSSITTKTARVPRFVPITESRHLYGTWELVKQRQDMESTPLEVEIRERRIKRHLFEQDVLLADAEASIDEFDNRLEELQRERIRVQEKNQLLELHLYQMHREMNVLNRFEAHEDRLAEKVYVKLMQVRGVSDQILDCEHRIIEHINEKEQLETLCQEIQRDFKKLVTDNKFADFLRRIFKKKYRPPRNRDDDDSTESESSSSSSEEEDEGSLDSRDIGPIRLDPNVCPEGCEQDIYDKTYELRNTRHKYEQDMMEQDRMVEILRRDIEAHNKVKRKLSVQLDERKNNLREFMMEKQSCMNDVDQVVVLRYDQIRAAAIEDCTGPQGLSQTVVFPEAMLHRLRRRVLELQDEIKQQKQRQKVNRTHLLRMNVDIKAMEETAQELRTKMRDVLTRKLGKPRRVDRTLDDMLKQLARRHKYSATFGPLPHIHTQITNWRKRQSTEEQKYLSALNEYSDRLRLAAALQADIIYPTKPTLEANRTVGGYDQEQYKRDVMRLRIIRQQQNQQIMQLRNEINELRLKPLTPLPQFLSQQTAVEKESEIYLHVPPSHKVRGLKYFPISPLGSMKEIDLVYDVNITKMVYDCLDAMRLPRDSTNEMLKEITELIPNIISGTYSLYDAVDELVLKWLSKTGGDPSQYKKHTKAFDSVAAVLNQLVRQQIDLMESEGRHGMLSDLESALKRVSGESEALKNRLGPALATLLHTADLEDIETADTMASLVKSLLDEGIPVTTEYLDRISPMEIMADIKDCGVNIPDEDIMNIITLALESLMAQIVNSEEANELDKIVSKAMNVDTQIIVSKASEHTMAVEHEVQDLMSGAAVSSKHSYRMTTSQHSATGKTSKASSLRMKPSGVHGGHHKHGSRHASDSEESEGGDLLWESKTSME